MAENNENAPVLLAKRKCLHLEVKTEELARLNFFLHVCDFESLALKLLAILMHFGLLQKPIPCVSTPKLRHEAESHISLFGSEIVQETGNVLKCVGNRDRESNDFERNCQTQRNS
jgi:hypothetical protein